MRIPSLGELSSRMESFESLMERIIAKSPSTKREELLRMVEERKTLSNGLLTDIGALSLLAQQFAVTQDGLATLADLKIASVHAGLNDITISGEIIDMSEPREFTRQDGSPGRVLRVTLADQSGRINCALWDDHVEVLSKQRIGVGSKVRVEHGYTKHGLAGEAEINLGNKGRITLLVQGTGLVQSVDPIPVAAKSSIESPLARIADLAERPGMIMRRIRVRIRKIQAQRTVDGPVSALCEDDSGLVMVKFWDERVGEVLGIGENRVVVIENPMVTERNGILYVNAGRSSMIKPEDTGEPDKGQSAAESILETIASLKPSLVLRTLKGRIVERTEVREVETKEGRRVRVANIRVEDETGKIRVSLWDRHAGHAESLRLGETVKLIGVRVREGFNREVEASSVYLTEIEKAK